LLEDGQRGVGHSDRDVARVGAEGSLGGEAGRAGEPARAADNEHGARGVLVLVGAAARDRVQDLGGDEAVLRLDLLEADVGDDDLAGPEPPGRDLHADLRRVHRDRHGRIHRCARDLAGRGVHARGQVDRHDRLPGAVHRRDRACRILARLAVEPGAEERVDDDVRLLDRRVVGRARSLAGGLEHLEGDSAVTAVRAPTAHGDEPLRVGEAKHRLLGHGAARPRHQLVHVVAGLSALHLLRGVERLKHP
jgi:hypothetical protein